MELPSLLQDLEGRASKQSVEQICRVAKHEAADSLQSSEAELLSPTKVSAVTVLQHCQGHTCRHHEYASIEWGLQLDGQEINNVANISYRTLMS